MLENMINSGELTEDMKKAMRKFASIQDMETESSENTNKRKDFGNGLGRGTGSIPSPAASTNEFFDPLL